MNRVCGDYRKVLCVVPENIVPFKFLVFVGGGGGGGLRLVDAKLKYFMEHCRKNILSKNQTEMKTLAL